MKKIMIKRGTRFSMNHPETGLFEVQVSEMQYNEFVNEMQVEFELFKTGGFWTKNTISLDAFKSDILKYRIEDQESDKMTVKAAIVCFSHISDVEHEIQSGLANETSVQRLEFAKYIITKCNRDLNMEIDPDELWERFVNRNS